ncbi:lysine-specific demethylase 5A [Caerostris extrusa]|uniref:Lysine-specific demethylase 5A n=1 Tax=Caerostris extrusa TaxID=172846 RepID=A0AAV4U7Y7_CAEEX|nr:lysine-specific demethylase 5A [Caerostris extrusa]
MGRRKRPDRPKLRSGEFHFQKEMKDGTVKTVKMRARLFDARKPKRRAARNKDADESCSAEGCLRPIGEAVNWVQCDGGCEQWFHLLCVGLDVTEVSESEDYICPNCAHASPHDSGGESDASEEVAASVLAGFARAAADSPI